MYFIIDTKTAQKPEPGYRIIVELFNPNDLAQVETLVMGAFNDEKVLARVVNILNNVGDRQNEGVTDLNTIHGWNAWFSTQPFSHKEYTRVAYELTNENSSMSFDEYQTERKIVLNYDGVNNWGTEYFGGPELRLKGFYLFYVNEYGVKFNVSITE